MPSQEILEKRRDSWRKLGTEAPDVGPGRERCMAGQPTPMLHTSPQDIRVLS